MSMVYSRKAVGEMVSILNSIVVLDMTVIVGYMSI
jgi:hypothetical protein